MAKQKKGDKSKRKHKETMAQEELLLCKSPKKQTVKSKLVQKSQGTLAFLLMKKRGTKLSQKINVIRISFLCKCHIKGSSF